MMRTLRPGCSPMRLISQVSPSPTCAHRRSDGPLCTPTLLVADHDGIGRAPTAPVVPAIPLFPVAAPRAWGHPSPGEQARTVAVRVAVVSRPISTRPPGLRAENSPRGTPNNSLDRLRPGPVPPLVPARRRRQGRAVRPDPGRIRGPTPRRTPGDDRTVSQAFGQWRGKCGDGCDEAGEFRLGTEHDVAMDGQIFEQVPHAARGALRGRRNGPAVRSR